MAREAESLLKVKDIMKRYGVSENTARKYIREMTHLVNPLRVTDKELRRWEEKRSRPAVDYQKAMNEFEAEKERQIIKLIEKRMRRNENRKA